MLHLGRTDKKAVVKEEGCPSRLHFVKKDGRWILNESKRNTVKRMCSFFFFFFYHFLLQAQVNPFLLSLLVKEDDEPQSQGSAFLNAKGLSKDHFRTVRRVVCHLKQKSAEKVEESEQKMIKSDT